MTAGTHIVSDILTCGERTPGQPAPPAPPPAPPPPAPPPARRPAPPPPGRGPAPRGAPQPIPANRQPTPAPPAPSGRRAHLRPTVSPGPVPGPDPDAPVYHPLYRKKRESVPLRGAGITRSSHISTVTPEGHTTQTLRRILENPDGLRRACGRMPHERWVRVEGVCVIGASAGKTPKHARAPCRTRAIPRVIGGSEWYAPGKRTPSAHSACVFPAPACRTPKNARPSFRPRRATSRVSGGQENCFTSGISPVRRSFKKPEHHCKEASHPPRRPAVPPEQPPRRFALRAGAFGCGRVAIRGYCADCSRRGLLEKGPVPC